MTTLSINDRTKLAKLLGMLGSSHHGERDAAALAANRFVQGHNLTWAQVLRPPAVEKALPEMGTWRQTVARCLEQRGSLRAWEVRFLGDLAGFMRISTKQRYVLAEIANRVLKERAQ